MTKDTETKVYYQRISVNGIGYVDYLKIDNEQKILFTSRQIEFSLLLNSEAKEKNRIAFNALKNRYLRKGYVLDENTDYDYFLTEQITREAIDMVYPKEKLMMLLLRPIEASYYYDIHAILRALDLFLNNDISDIYFMTWVKFYSHALNKTPTKSKKTKRYFFLIIKTLENAVIADGETENKESREKKILFAKKEIEKLNQRVIKSETLKEITQ